MWWMSIFLQLGMSDMFTNAANLKGLFESPKQLKVFEVHHSSSMRVDEVHAEIASGSSTYMTINKLNCVFFKHCQLICWPFSLLFYRYSTKYICTGRWSNLWACNWIQRKPSVYLLCSKPNRWYHSFQWSTCKTSFGIKTDIEPILIDFFPPWIHFIIFTRVHLKCTFCFSN